MILIVVFLARGILPAQTETMPRGVAPRDSVKRASLRVFSEPTGANVFANGVFVGFTPLSCDREAADSLHIRVEKKSYRLWETTVRVKAGDTLTLTAFPQRLDALLSVTVSDSGAEVLLDGLRIGTGSVTGYAVLPGGHQITVRDAAGIRAVTRAIVLGEGVSQSYSAELGYRSPWRLVGSIALPGYAQCADGAYLKGAAVFAVSVAALVFAINSAGGYSDRLGEYNGAVASYAAARTEQDAVIRHNILFQRHDDVKIALHVRNVSLGVLGAVYAMTLTDAILNHLVTDDIRLLPGAVSVKLAAAHGPHSVALRTEILLR